MTSHPKSSATPQSTGEATSQSETPHTYRYAKAGIEERHGAVPLWLTLVAIGLIAWAIYYTIRYWDAP